MKRQRVYIDTSVLGGCFDPEFAPWSNTLMHDSRSGRLTPVLSDVTAAEVVGAPEPVRDLHAELLGLGADLLPVTTEVLALLRAYEARGILGERFRNFRHIVRLDRIRLFGAVNLELGYRVLSIYSPREVASYGEE